MKERNKIAVTSHEIIYLHPFNKKEESRRTVNIRPPDWELVRHLRCPYVDSRDAMCADDSLVEISYLAYQRSSVRGMVLCKIMADDDAYRGLMSTLDFHIGV